MRVGPGRTIGRFLLGLFGMTAAPTVFVIHQIGSGADGGIQSISELLFNTPRLEKLVITNIETPASAKWNAHGDVAVWNMREAAHADSRRGAGYRAAQVWRRLANNWRMARLVRREGVKVVHCNDHRAFWNTALGAKLAGARVILNVRDTMRPGARSHFMWRLALRICDLFLVLSQDMIDSWVETLTPLSLKESQRAKFAFLYSIVDMKRFYPVSPDEKRTLRRELGIGEGEIAIAYVGRIEAKKAQLPFIRQALVPLMERVPNVHVQFVGDFLPDRDAYSAACERAVAESGCGRAVSFAGYTARSADWYRACDVLVLASEREGLPRCVIEGLACGAAVVSFDVCSVREILEGHDCGRVVNQGEYEKLVTAIAALCDNPRERARLAARGPEVAARLFDARRNGDLYADLVMRLS